MSLTQQTRAENNYKILAYLFTNNSWKNIREIGKKIGIKSKK